jgi:hypothetical protein
MANGRQLCVRKQRPPALRRRTDWRTLRSCRALGEALVRLRVERGIDGIRVQDALTGAKVGRTTFYAWRGLPTER